MKKKEKSVVVNQVMPKKNNTKAIWDLVLRDIKERDKNGLKKYGVRLQAFNGRNSVIDAYQEVLDLVVYFRQLIEERDVLINFIKEVSNCSTADWEFLSEKSLEILEDLGEE